MRVIEEAASRDERVPTSPTDPARHESHGGRRHARHVGLTADLGMEWLEAVGSARVPDAFAFLDGELE